MRVLKVRRQELLLSLLIRWQPEFILLSVDGEYPSRADPTSHDNCHTGSIYLHEILKNAFKKARQSIPEKKWIFMAVDFPKRVVHGGTGKRQLERTRKNVLDFSASVNPFPPHFEWHCDPKFLASYPDDSYYELKKRIGAVFHRNPEEISVGNGSIELIRVFCQVVLSGDKHFFLRIADIW